MSRRVVLRRMIGGAVLLLGAVVWYFLMPFQLFSDRRLQVASLAVAGTEYVIAQQFDGDMYHVELFARRPDGRWDGYLLDNDDIYWRGKLVAQDGRIDVWRYGSVFGRLDPTRKLLTVRNSDVPRPVIMVGDDPFGRGRSASPSPQH